MAITVEAMAQLDNKTKEAFSKALQLLNQIQKSSPSEAGREREILVWKCAAEVEYLAFRIATIHGLSDYDPHWVEVGEVSVEAIRSLLEAARTDFESDPRRAYEEVRRAVSLLRKMRVATRGRRRHIPPPKNG